MPSEVPLPAAVWLFGSGLMGFMAMRRRAKAQVA
ncbi:VPLPA-CTERM sorting domain-containing protein [Methylophaga muralis]|nr:VPLPA-CTERM sorting domain-containing protein [Methylophaga muralis]